MAREIDPVYEQFLAGKVAVMGRDLCDMSGAQARPLGHPVCAHVVPATDMGRLRQFLHCISHS